MELSDKIDPGQTKWRGQLLFELQSASVILAQRALNEENMSAYQAKVNKVLLHFNVHSNCTIYVFLKEIFEENALRLREAVSILAVEPDQEFKDKLQEQMERISKMVESVEE